MQHIVIEEEEEEVDTTEVETDVDTEEKDACGRHAYCVDCDCCVKCGCCECKKSEYCLRVC